MSYVLDAYISRKCIIREREREREADLSLSLSLSFFQFISLDRVLRTCGKSSSKSKVEDARARPAFLQ